MTPGDTGADLAAHWGVHSVRDLAALAITRGDKLGARVDELGAENEVLREDLERARSCAVTLEQENAALLAEVARRRSQVAELEHALQRATDVSEEHRKTADTQHRIATRLTAERDRLQAQVDAVRALCDLARASNRAGKIYVPSADVRRALTADPAPAPAPADPQATRCVIGDDGACIVRAQECSCRQGDECGEGETAGCCYCAHFDIYQPCPAEPARPEPPPDGDR